MKTRRKRMKKLRSKITLLLSNLKAVLYSRLEMQEKFIWTGCGLHFNLLRAYVGDACQQLPFLDY
jgi:hypothetical protein